MAGSVICDVHNRETDRHGCLAKWLLSLVAIVVITGGGVLRQSPLLKICMLL